MAIYGANIRVEDRSGTAFAPPLPRTLHIEGALFLRPSRHHAHTLANGCLLSSGFTINALYTHPPGEVQRVRVHGLRSSCHLRPDSVPEAPMHRRRVGLTRKIGE